MLQNHWMLLFVIINKQFIFLITKNVSSLFYTIIYQNNPKVILIYLFKNIIPIIK